MGADGAACRIDSCFCDEELLPGFFFRCFRRQDAQQPPALFEERFSGPVGEESEVSDFDKPCGKHVGEKTADELEGMEVRDPGFIGFFGVPVSECHPVGVCCDDSGVGNGDSMGVSSQIGQDVLGFMEGRFAIDDPFLLIKGG